MWVLQDEMNPIVWLYNLQTSSFLNTSFFFQLLYYRHSKILHNKFSLRFSHIQVFIALNNVQIHFMVIQTVFNASKHIPICIQSLITCSNPNHPHPNPSATLLPFSEYLWFHSSLFASKNFPNFCNIQPYGTLLNPNALHVKPFSNYKSFSHHNLFCTS